MFAAAAREVVFSNPEVVRRVNESFIPVALKAGLVNNPPAGAEGDLYREILRTRPAPQGICAMNSSGKLLAWALSFDSNQTIPAFLDFIVERYQEQPDSKEPVTTRRFMKYPGQPLPSVKDTGRALDFPSQHLEGSRCPAEPGTPTGTLVGRVIGRALDEDGQPIADTRKQEHYMEARFEIPIKTQKALAGAVASAGDARFSIPEALIRGLVGPSYLGQLDVNPLGLVPGSQNKTRWWRFEGEKVATHSSGATRVRITGRSHLEGSQRARARRSDGRLWEHAVTLDWQGYIELREDRVLRLDIIAQGHERLRWGNSRRFRVEEPDAAHLMAGHPIDLRCGVRYALHAEP